MMKKWFDNFVVNALIAMVVVLYMLVEEQRLYPGHPLTEDLLYGGFLALCGSFLAEVAKVIFVRKIDKDNKWRCFWQWAVGAVVGFVAAVGVGHFLLGIG